MHFQLILQDFLYNFASKYNCMSQNLQNMQNQQLMWAAAQLRRRGKASRSESSSE
jgi:hypothetical protein